MSKNFKVQVEFSPIGEQPLIDALKALAAEQIILSKANANLQISAERVNQAQIRTKILLDRATTSAEKNRLAVEKLKVQKKTKKSSSRKIILPNVRNNKRYFSGIFPMNVLQDALYSQKARTRQMSR